MKVTLTFWRAADAPEGDPPMVVDAIDDFAIDDGRTPAFPTEESVLECFGPGEVRRITIHVSDREVMTLFDPDPVGALGYEHPRLPDEWCRLYGFRVTTPTGWLEDDADWDTPITRGEFLRRATASLLEPGPKANDGVYEGSKDRHDGTEAFQCRGRRPGGALGKLDLREHAPPAWLVRLYTDGDLDEWLTQIEDGQWLVHNDDEGTVSIEEDAPWE